MLPTQEFISNFVENQFPSFYREEGQTFIAFVKAYYEWLEETGNQAHKTRNLFSTRDIDLTADQFVEEFKQKYLFGVPKEIAGDKRFLQKHILDLYRSKGSYEGLKLLFRLLYNEDIQIYIPSTDILKTSDGIWVEKKYLEVTFTGYNKDFVGQQITGVVSGATAFVEDYQKLFVNGTIVNLFFISNIEGTFAVTEKIIFGDLDAINAPVILGSPETISIDYTQPDNNLGDILIPSSGNGTGEGLKLLITSTKNAGSANGTIVFTVQDGGRGYTNSPTISITSGSNSTGSGATFTGVTLKNTELFQYSTAYIDYTPYTSAQTFNANTAVNSTADFISFSGNKFANGDYVRYLVAAGNTAISGLSNGSYYFVVGANSSGIQLATGNTLTYNTSPINITKGLTQSGHSLNAISTSNLRLNAVTYGSALLNANLSTVIDNALAYQTVTIGTIDKLTGINPGTGYDGYVNISITDPLISGFGIPDGYKGGIKGADAVISGNVQIGTGLVETVKVKNSGFGYNTNLEEIQIYNNTQSNTSKISKGAINLGAVGVQEGFWQTTKGFLDSNKFIQDSYYYQEYSYEIKSSKSLDKYLSILKDVFHPVGNQPFGKALILAEDVSQTPEITNTITIYRILGAALAPAPAGTDPFRLNISRLT